jgi:hypothetical protein
MGMGTFFVLALEGLTIWRVNDFCIWQRFSPRAAYRFLRPRNILRVLHSISDAIDGLRNALSSRIIFTNTHVGLYGK